jgi:hypothetical protein
VTCFRTRFAAAAVIGLAGSLLLAGCSTTPFVSSNAAAGKASSSASTSGGSTSVVSPAAGGDAGACRLVTVADATAAMGEPMTQSGGTAADCIYAATADQGQQLLVHEFLDQTNMNNLMQQLESSSEHVDGLGDDAFWNGTIDTMFVRTGTRGFTITSTSLGAKTPTDPDGAKASLVSLASTALSSF